jgi:hypothetical protein
MSSLPQTPGSTQKAYVPFGHVQVIFSWRWNQVEINLMSAPLNCAVDGRPLYWKRRWERGFAELRKFCAREGHCCPSRRHVEGAFNLGQWVSVQRYRKDVLSVERKRRLDKIGFVWVWRDNHWEQNFAALLKFRRRQGHCCVPIAFKEGDLKLGWWVATQRRNRKEMSTERRARLNKIGFVWHAPRPYRPTGAPRPQSPISDHPSTSAESRV